MFHQLITFCLKEQLVVLLVLLLIVSVGLYSIQEVPIDAIPDIGENQVIVLTSWMGRSPKDIEDQITYPLSVALLSVPGAESVRAKSLFGYSFVQVTFADDVDFYWARSRVSEQLTTVQSQLPEGVSPALGPDATGLGQVLYYTLNPAEGMNLSDLRSLQDFVVKYELQAVDGVSEVASVGGYVKQYQVDIDPNKLRFHNIPLDRLIKAIKESNIDVGAKTIESTGMEFVLRGKGFIGAKTDPNKAIEDIEETVVVTREGVPVRIKDLGYVQLGPGFRRGALDLNGVEAVGGVIVMRYGENPRAVINRVKEKMKQVEPGLNGATLEIVYDRTELINETVTTLTSALQEEVIITMGVILLFLLHFRASLVVALTLPVAVLMAFIAMLYFNVNANIMSLAGIAIAVGTMVDLGIVVSENIYRHLADWEENGSPGGKKERFQVILSSTLEVSPAVLTAVSTTVISFLPVFFLTGRDYKLFAPLAWTKTFSLVSSFLVAVFFIPVISGMLLRSVQRTWKRTILLSLIGGTFVSCAYLLLRRGLQWGLKTYSPELKEFGLQERLHSWGEMLEQPIQQWGMERTLLGIAGLVFLMAFWLLRERLRPMEKNRVSRLILWFYQPTLRWFLNHKLIFGSLISVVLILGLGAYFGLPRVLKPIEQVVELTGADFNEVPGYVDFKHRFLGLKDDDWIALDEGSWFYMPSLYPAASFSQAMQVLQTQDAMIREIPEVLNVLGKIGRVESALDPAPAAMIETYVMLKPKSDWREGWNERRIWDEINKVAALPGVTPAAALQPIQGRVVMLQSGIKASVAIRIYGDDLEELNQASQKIASLVKSIREVEPTSVNPDIVLGKPYLEFEVDRKMAARFGMTTQMVTQIIEAALGGKNVTQTVEGRERYPIQVRYQRHLREKIEELERLPVVTHTGEIIPLSMLAKMNMVWGPGMMASEDARLIAHVSFSPKDEYGDLETVRIVESVLKERLERSRDDPKRLTLPEGYVVRAVGSFENQVEANLRLAFIIPMVILLNLFLIYLQFRDLPLTLAIFSAIPVAFAGGMILLGFAEVKMNTAVWIGFIALFGIAIDDGVVMATYLKQIFNQHSPETVRDVRLLILEAGSKRIRPCLMTTFTTLVALIPVLFSTGRGAEIAKGMAIPVFGGMSIELLTLFVVPVLFSLSQEFKVHLGFSSEQERPTREVNRSMNTLVP